MPINKYRTFIKNLYFIKSLKTKRSDQLALSQKTPPKFWVLELTKNQFSKNNACCIPRPSSLLKEIFYPKSSLYGHAGVDSYGVESWIYFEP